jgi:hypothetical protein
MGGIYRRLGPPLQEKAFLLLATVQKRTDLVYRIKRLRRFGYKADVVGRGARVLLWVVDDANALFQG